MPGAFEYVIMRQSLPCGENARRPALWHRFSQPPDFPESPSVPTVKELQFIEHRQAEWAAWDRYLDADLKK
ncbi:MAG TPA: hypothetical protein PLW86_10280, partial [Rhodocyclaceae bacterium]|nr:hypothetical protein [Rhodocyclaceae bacterium]